MYTCILPQLQTHIHIHMYLHIHINVLYICTTSSLPPLSPPTLPPRSLPCNRSIASTSPKCTIYFHYLPVFFRSCRSCLHLLPHLLLTSILPRSLLQYRVSEGCSYARCDQSSWPSFVLLFLGCSFRPWRFVMLLNFLHDLPNSSSPLFSGTVFQNLQDISDHIHV